MNKKNTISFETYLNTYHTIQTCKSYLYNINIFLDKNPKANNYNYADILKVLHEEKTTRGGLTSVYSKIAAIKKYYDYLIEVGIRNNHPCKNLKTKKSSSFIQTQDLFSKQELEILLQTVANKNEHQLRQKLIISFLIYQGMSSYEVSMLKIDDIDLENGLVTIAKNRNKNKRVVELKSKQILWLQTYLETIRANYPKSLDGILMINTKGEFYNVASIFNLVESYKPLYLDKKLNPTKIRQSVISILLNESNNPLETVQLFAGHKWPMTTEKYKNTDLFLITNKTKNWHPLDNGTLTEHTTISY
jgi:site-specific recombinase XerD